MDKCMNSDVQLKGSKTKDLLGVPNVVTLNNQLSYYSIQKQNQYNNNTLFTWWHQKEQILSSLGSWLLPYHLPWFPAAVWEAPYLPCGHLQMARAREGQEARRQERGWGGDRVRGTWTLPSGRRAALTLPPNSPGAPLPGHHLWCRSHCCYGGGTARVSGIEEILEKKNISHTVRMLNLNDFS